MMPLPPQLMMSMVALTWRLQKVRSWVFITSLAASAEETTSVGTEPKRSSMSGPYAADSSRSAW